MSWNGIPIPGMKHIEGSGLRWWRIALGLSVQKDMDVTIALWKAVFTNNENHLGIQITSWGQSESDDEKLLSHYDTVIMPMSMSGHTSRLAKMLNNKQQLIIDAYAPFYVEATTRSESKKDDRQNDDWYEGILWAGNEALVCSDYILYASKSQRDFYTGLLAGLGALTPKYAQRDRFVHLPGAIEYSANISDTDPYKKLGIDEKSLKILWFGALYPWYDIEHLIKAFSRSPIKDKAVLVIVGGSNPMYPKDNLRFNGQYNKAQMLSKELGTNDKSVIFHDWVEYNDRINWFKHCDVAISINADTIENQFSWRIRIADLAGNKVPIITNGGDPLGEELLSYGAAFRVHENTELGITTVIDNLINHPTAITDARLQLEKLDDQLHIYRYTSELAAIIRKGDRPRTTQEGSARSIVMSAKLKLQQEVENKTRDISELRSTIEAISLEMQRIQKEYTSLNSKYRKTLLGNYERGKRLARRVVTKVSETRKSR